jgi:transcriptional regulator with XRE-family HTH domain
MPSITNERKGELIRLGMKIKSIRKGKNLTLEQVGFTIGKDRQSIHKLEKGDFNPSYLYLLDVCKGLGIKLSSLLDD